MLTKEQQDMVLKNENLIFYTLKLYNFSIESYYETACIGLCKAACSWNPKKGKFSTFAVPVIRNEILMDIRKEKKNIKAISLETKIPCGSENLLIRDSIEDDSDLISDREDLYVAMLIYKKVKFSKIEKYIFELYLLGIKQKDIEKMSGFAQSHISRVFIRCKKKLRAVYNKEMGL